MSSTASTHTLDTTVIQAIASAVELSVNTALRYDPATKKSIAELTDILAVEITTPSMCFYIHGQEEGIAVLSYCERPVTTHLSGSIIDLIGLLKQPTNLANSGVALSGSTGLLQQWQTILSRLDIDWEEAISGVMGTDIGDIVGPLATNHIRTSTQWAKAQVEEQKRLVGEYLSEELHVAPSQVEANAFYDEIDTIKLKVDRLGARIQALGSTINKQRENTQ